MIDKNSFLNDVKDHKMIIMRDDGLYRHIRFKRPGTNCMYFDLITWPGNLCFTGDMGTNVFSRVEDMFDFFRSGPELSINLEYWSEKLLAVDGNKFHSAVTEFDKEKFEKTIKEIRMDWIEESIGAGSLNKEQRRELWDAVENDVMGCLDDGQEWARQAANDFLYKNENGEWCFQDLFEYNFDKFSTHFEWCCYAIAWGIWMYELPRDEHKIEVDE